ncbi:hypothetical protein B0H14DRAFT_2828203 [Mycena olivaceomarginata]|nr:hypothetical protein B0H14DRAFT_2828203 [Mycena olivaceomarginata]
MGGSGGILGIGYDFRSIPLGDLNLLTQVSQEPLGCDVLEQRGGRTIVRREIIGKRTVYRARIFGSQDPMTAVVYQGSQFEKWKAEAERRQSVRSPIFLQLFGITESRGMNALIYHDELITIKQFRQLYYGLPLTSAFTEYQMARDLPNTVSYGYYTTSIRLSTGRLCLHDQFSPTGEDDELEMTCDDLFPWNLPVVPHARDVEAQLFSRMSVPDVLALLAPFRSFRFDIKTLFHGRVPLAQLATVDGDLLDFQFAFSAPEIKALDVDISPWAPEEPGRSLLTDFTSMDDGWTRIALSATSTTELAFYSHIEIGMPWAEDYVNKRWLSEATRILGDWIAADNLLLNDLCLVDGADLSFRLHYPKYTHQVDPPSVLYLFVFRPKIGFDEHGKCFVDVPPPGKRLYWSLDPSGAEPFDDGLGAHFAVPRAFFEVNVMGWSWTARQYNTLANFEEAKEHDTQRFHPRQLTELSKHARY